jgi:uncharacterized membrane protein YccC
MPMTARLAQTLQEKLGSEGAAEMITWFDETQRGTRQDLRELIELNFSRFDARMGERIAVLDQKFSERISGVEQKLGERIAAVDARLFRWMIGLWIVTLSAMGVLKIVR